MTYPNTRAFTRLGLRSLDPQEPDEQRLVLLLERDDVEDSEVNLVRPVSYGAV
jgi:hypothetical protein